MKRNGAGASLIIPSDYIGTLWNCEGYYECPRGPEGEFLGPLVGYAGKYKAADGSEKNYVGEAYLNFSMADQWPAVREFFAKELARRIRNGSVRLPTVVMGMPMAGINLSASVARDLECRSIFAEKQVVKASQDGGRDEERLALLRYTLDPGDLVMIGEELVNNLSTAKKACELVESAGGEVVGISCAINRSDQQTFWMPPDRDPIPIISVIGKPMPQYRQDDPLVAAEIEKENIVWKPKHDWPRLKAAMEKRITS